jgi:hypothetical protein
MKLLDQILQRIKAREISNIPCYETLYMCLARKNVSHEIMMLLFPKVKVTIVSAYIDIMLYKTINLPKYYTEEQYRQFLADVNKIIVKIAIDAVEIKLSDGTTIIDL